MRLFQKVTGSNILHGIHYLLPLKEIRGIKATAKQKLMDEILILPKFVAKP